MALFRSPLKEAEERGALAADLKSHFREDDARFKALGEDVTETKLEVKGLSVDVRNLTTSVERREAVAETTAEQTRELAAKQITSKTLWVSLLSAAGGLGVLFVTVFSLVHL